MRVFGRYLIPTVIAAALIGPVIAGTIRRPVHWERLTLPAAERQKLVLDDLASITTGPASGDTVATAPYLSAPGLCRRDVVRLNYELIDKNGPAKWKPVGVASVFSQYHALGEGSARTMAEWGEACAHLSGDAVWASAPEDFRRIYDTDERAAFAFRTLKLAVDSLRSGKRVKIACAAEETTLSDAQCRARFIAASASVDRFVCQQDARQCFYSLGDYDASVTDSWRPDSSRIENQMVEITLTRKPFR